MDSRTPGLGTARTRNGAGQKPGCSAEAPPHGWGFAGGRARSKTRSKPTQSKITPVTRSLRRAVEVGNGLYFH
jgi:hypothetical protein